MCYSDVLQANVTSGLLNAENIFTFEEWAKKTKNK
jgi:hypothetical protein